MYPEDRDHFMRRAIIPVAVLVLEVVVIGVASVSSELSTIDAHATKMFKNEPMESAYGWPLAFYWRTEVPSWAKNYRATSQYSAWELMMDAAMWIVALTVTWFAVQRLRRRYPRWFAWKPRPVTLFLLVVVSVLILLANLSCDISPDRGPMQQSSYGWPLTCLRRINMGSGQPYREWYVRAPAFVANVTWWLVILAVTTIPSEWLLGDFRLRFRWRLRTMMLATTLLATVCAWGANAQKLAHEQEAIIATVFDKNVSFQRWGPGWLDLFGADCLRRDIVGVRVYEDELNGHVEELLKRLAGLPRLRFLGINPGDSQFVFTPSMGIALTSMSQLRSLKICCQGDGPGDSSDATHECLTAVSKLNQLERLNLALWEEDSEDLALLNQLAGLRSLALDVTPFNSDENVRMNEKDREPRALTHLPVLPQLEDLALLIWEFGDDDVSLLARFSRLRSLRLSQTSVTDEGLAKLEPLDSLEELTIDEGMATAAGFQALAALKHLRCIKIDGPARSYSSDVKVAESRRRADVSSANEAGKQALRAATIVLDDNYELLVLADELHDLRRAIHALRQSNPGITIAAVRMVSTKGNLEPIWD